MSSYYERVMGNLASAEIAKSEDIHSVQTNIQTAFQDMLKDLFGDGCILDDDEEALKITPTPLHIDQFNKNYDSDDSFISFYNTYLRQKIVTEKSEIQSIKLQVRNDSNIEPTIFAEIRDNDMNLLKESNLILKSTLDENSPDTIEFIFNLKHLPIGEYYFVLRPVDITSVDMSMNGDESIYDTVGKNSFLVRYDRGGNYNESLDASKNGVDYLESRMLEEKVIYGGDIVEIHNNNFDLYFEQIYSSGNTYVINPAPCLVLGQKTYPIDTHITIDGPSKIGNRIDLISLTTDGLLQVTSGLPFTGQPKTSDYPVNTLGFKVAYIITYQNSDAYWTCPVCGTINDGNIHHCQVCDTTTNSKIPKIEQNDDNNITRRRDVLERLRRLEKKLNYQVQNNSPSRIKTYIITDPTLAIDKEEVEGTYKVSASNNTNGETIITFDNDKKETYAWSIIDKKTITTATESNIVAEMLANNVTTSQTKPKKPRDGEYYILKIKEKSVSTTSDVSDEQHHTSTTSYDVTDETEESVIGSLKVDIYIKDKNGKTLVSITDKKTSAAGVLKLSLWSYNLKPGSYKIVAEYASQKLSTDLTIYASTQYKINSDISRVPITIPEFKKSSTVTNIDNSTIPGNDSFYTNNMEVDTEIGEVRISKIKESNPKKTTWTTVTDKEIKDLKYSNQSFTIQSSTTSQQSTYGMLNFDMKNDCTLYSITPYIEKFTNIEKYKIVLFKNDKIFNLDASRSSYEKEIATDKAKDTSFPNVYESEWYEPAGTKDGDSIKPKTYTFDFNKKPIELKKGTYSLVILGTLKDKKKDGTITIKQYHISDIGYGSASKVKGTYNPSKIFIEKNSLTNRTWKLEMSIYIEKYNTTGTLISKTIDTVDNIQSCTITTNYEVPPTCDIETYVSNNGGRTYVPIGNETNTATFVGLGHEFRWRLVFHGTGSITPKLKFNDDPNMRCAIKFELSEVENYIGYEDYGRCFASPIMNGNYIGWSGTQDAHAKNIFEEWEFFRIWMEDPNRAATMDLCFAYDYDNYSLNANDDISKWPATIFFSQIISNLNLNDFSQDSIDYDNYNANVEYDENNYRFFVDTPSTSVYKEVITTPLANLSPTLYDYYYGDITPADIDMSEFDYGIMKPDIVYSDNYDIDGDDSTVDDQMRYAGVYTLIGPYYQAMYNPTVEKTSLDLVWASDSDPNYDPNACIIGVSFANGLEVKDEYTSLTIDVFPNLRDCVEQEGSEFGELALENNLPKLKSGTSYNDKKYVGDDGFYYIPANTLEVVISLNPYGLIEDKNATYGKAYPITIPLRSCKFNQVEINLADLYGSTIYSIGIRVSTQKDINGNYEVHAEGEKHRSLHQGDILGLGTIQWNGNSLVRYAPFSFTGDTSRWNWDSIQKNQKSNAYILYQTTNISDDDTNDILLWSKYPLTRDPDPDCTWYTQYGTTLIQKKIKTGWTPLLKRNIHKINVIDTTNNNKVVRQSNDNSNSIVFELNSQDPPANLFKINTDVYLTPYDWILIKYRMEHIKGELLSGTNIKDDSDHTGYFKTGSQLFKGEVILDLYDTTDIDSADPIESLALPAWGRIQENYGNNNPKVTPDMTPKTHFQELKQYYVNKQVHAWFKKHTNASQVKCIVLRTENPTKRERTDVNLIIDDIIFVNQNGISSFGPQLHARIYPQNMNNYTNTKIRKIGGVFRVR